MSAADTYRSYITGLKDDYGMLFLRSMPGAKKFMDNGKASVGQGTTYLAGDQWRFNVMRHGPGRVVAMNTYRETWTPSTYQVTTEGHFRAHRGIYTYALVGGELAETFGEGGADKVKLKGLEERYHGASMAEFNSFIWRQFTGRTGGISDTKEGVAVPRNCTGYTSLNGDSTFLPKGVSYTGVIQFAARTAQTATVFGIPCEGAATNPVAGWYTPHAVSTGWSTNGPRSVCSTYFEIGRNQGRQNAMAQNLIGLCDPTSHLNYFEGQSDQVRGQNVVQALQGLENLDAEAGVPFLDAMVWSDWGIQEGADNSTFTTPVVGGLFSGVWYWLDPDTWGMVNQGKPGSIATGGIFDVDGPTKIPGSDQHEVTCVRHGNLYCVELRRNGSTIGTAQT